MDFAQLFQRWDHGGKIPPAPIYAAHIAQRAKSNFKAASGPHAAFIYSGASDYLLQIVMHTSPYDLVREPRLSFYVNSKRLIEVVSFWFRQIIDGDPSTAFPRSHRQVPLLAFSDPLPANMPRGSLSFSSSRMEFQYKDFSQSAEGQDEGLGLSSPRYDLRKRKNPLRSAMGS